MTSHLSSAKSAKDIGSLFMSDKEYEELKAKHRHAKREQILQPRKPLRPTKFGMFVAGICVGAILAYLTAFVISVSGPGAGIAVAIGTAIMLAVAGVQMGADE
jgi:uncharacterized oligopeptide transporter (OPT) family protein